MLIHNNHAAGFAHLPARAGVYAQWCTLVQNQRICNSNMSSRTLFKVDFALNVQKCPRTRQKQKGMAGYGLNWENSSDPPPARALFADLSTSCAGCDDDQLPLAAIEGQLIGENAADFKIERMQCGFGFRHLIKRCRTLHRNHATTSGKQRSSQ